MKNYFVGLFLALALVPLTSSAQNITELQALIAQLRAQIVALQQGGGNSCLNFKQNLRIGDANQDVARLNQFLEQNGFGLALKSGDRFEEFTAAGVVAFQEKYSAEVLAPHGLSHGTGFVGPATRAKLNQLYGCSGRMLPVIGKIVPNLSTITLPGINVDVRVNGQSAWSVVPKGAKFTLSYVATGASYCQKGMKENSWLLADGSGYWDSAVQNRPTSWQVELINDKPAGTTNTIDITCYDKNGDSQTGSAFFYSQTSPEGGKPNITVGDIVNINLPDLVVTDVYSELNYLSGNDEDKFNVIVAKVCNVGSGPTPRFLPTTGYFYTQFEFPNGQVQYGSDWDENGRLLGANHVIQPGECVWTRGGLHQGFGLRNGNYTVRVSADTHQFGLYDNLVVESNEKNNSLSKNIRLTFGNTAELSATVASPQDQVTVPIGNTSFTGTAAGGAGSYKYYWDFGDGGGSHSNYFEGGSQTILHYFNTPGTFTVKLYVTDSAGNQASAQLITVNVIANGSFTILSPTKSAVWHKNSELYRVSWRSNGEVNQNDRVQVDLVGTRYGLASGQLVRDGYVEINTPSDVAPGSYQIKITDLNNSSIFGISDYFTISQ